jgi:hypothetical protein
VSGSDDDFDNNDFDNNDFDNNDFDNNDNDCSGNDNGNARSSAVGLDHPFGHRQRSGARLHWLEKALNLAVISPMRVGLFPCLPPSG